MSGFLIYPMFMSVAGGGVLTSRSGLGVSAVCSAAGGVGVTSGAGGMTGAAGSGAGGVGGTGSGIGAGSGAGGVTSSSGADGSVVVADGVGDGAADVVASAAGAATSGSLSSRPSNFFQKDITFFQLEILKLAMHSVGYCFLPKGQLQLFFYFIRFNLNCCFVFMSFDFL